ncbi:MAG: mucoidy inhibitor MuiA family protein [Prevotellaceae bacterium]|jgi:uncharacterized protein (TIGR02231 family)|nr:mucoidy inhibitor MuiA family protein [Prevotellaceae bacterium]
MKKVTFLTTILLFTITELQSQDSIVAANTAIGGVTVFIRGAEVQREAFISLKAGAQRVIFENLPQGINSQSIQVAGTGNFTILGVSHKRGYTDDSKPAAKTKEVEDLEKMLEKLEEKAEMQQAALNDLEDETAMLKKNEAIGGSQTGVNIDELKKFTEFFRSRLTELTKNKLEINRKLRETSAEMQRLQNRLKESEAVSRKTTSSIAVDVAASAAVQAKFSVTYLVLDAGWTASYDLRVSDINNPVELTYKANVYQNTGEDWKNVKPVFSTANPTLGNSKPALSPWYLSFDAPAPDDAHQNFKIMPRHLNQKDDFSEREREILEEESAVSTADLTTVQENQTSVEFAIAVPYTIPGDGQTYSVELAKHSLPAIYEYYAVRKLEKDVFLLARITGWEKLDLLSGSANIFFEGKFTGQSYIETRQTNNVLALSLGRDKNITVTRIRKKDYSEKQFLGGNITETREWDLTVHNRKRQPIRIIVEDQLPVSTGKEIKIEALNISNAETDDDTGKLTWVFELKPAESRSMNVKYSVRYPKNKQLNI